MTIIPSTHHVSYGIVQGNTITGTTMSVTARIQGTLRPDGTVCNFGKLKLWLKAVDAMSDHRAFIPREHPLVGFFEKERLAHTLVEEEVSIQTIIRLLYVDLERRINEIGQEINIHSLEVSEVGGDIWTYIDGEIHQRTSPPQVYGDNQLEVYFHLAHRMPQDPKCRNLHGHRWTVIAESSTPITDMQRRSAEEYVRENWNHQLALGRGDTIIEPLRSHGIRVEEIDPAATTEVLAEIMKKRLSEIVGKIEKLTLIETPSNRVEKI